MVRRGRLSGKKEIDEGVRGILIKYKIGKHFQLDIRGDGFDYQVNEEAILALAVGTPESELCPA